MTLPHDLNEILDAFPELRSLAVGSHKTTPLAHVFGIPTCSACNTVVHVIDDAPSVVSSLCKQKKPLTKHLSNCHSEQDLHNAREDLHDQQARAEKATAF